MKHSHKLWACLSAILIGINLLLASQCCLAAALPEKITGSKLQRTDCLIAETDLQERFIPYIEEFLFSDQRAGLSLYSCVNWREGILKSEGIGKNRSKRAAELVARNNALKTLIALNLTSESTLQTYFDQQQEVKLKIESVLIKNADIQELPADNDAPDQARVMVTIPFYGISGLISFFVDDQKIYLESPGSASSDTPPIMVKNESEDYTGILIDACGIPTLAPALFPRILSEDGEVLYAASQVQEDVLLERGMVEYILEQAQTTAWRAGENPYIVTPILIASASPDIPVVPSPSQRFLPDLFLAEVKSRKGRGQKNALVVTATDDVGQIAVNVVVSVEDAQKIKQLNAQQQFDNQGNYTILIGREIGGVQGQTPTSLYARRFR